MCASWLQALAAGGFRALIWDRPNCGASDLAFRGDSESVLNADVLAGLIRKLDLGPTILAGGSAGSRVSLLTATRHPQAAAGLFLWWITGGAIGLAALVGVYCGDAALTAAAGGMEAVAAMSSWREQLARNPGNRGAVAGARPGRLHRHHGALGGCVYACAGLAGTRDHLGRFRCPRPCPWWSCEAARATFITCAERASKCML